MPPPDFATEPCDFRRHARYYAAISHASRRFRRCTFSLAFFAAMSLADRCFAIDVYALR